MCIRDSLKHPYARVLTQALSSPFDLRICHCLEPASDRICCSEPSAGEINCVRWEIGRVIVLRAGWKSRLGKSRINRKSHRCRAAWRMIRSMIGTTQLGQHLVHHEQGRTTPGFKRHGPGCRQHWMQALFQSWSPSLIPLDTTTWHRSGRKV